MIMMKRANHLIIVLIVLLVSSCNEKRIANQNQSCLSKEIESLRADYNIPAISYGVIKNDTIILEKTIGYRDIKVKDRTKINDLFHIGENTNAFTSFISAELIEQGLISWETKFFDLYPELKDNCNEAYLNINLKDLLSHQTCLIKFKDESSYYPLIEYEGSLDPWLTLPEKRYHFIKNLLKYDPAPIEEDPYKRKSNAGYIAAALMLEKASGKTWEQLVDETSGNLNINLHIGWPDSANQDGPKGHIDPKLWDLDIAEAVIPMPFALKRYHYFNQYALLGNPSHNLSISLPDYLEFLRINIQGLNGTGNYLASRTYREMFYAYPDSSCGWINDVDDYNVPCFVQKGSLGTFDSMAIIVPEKHLGIVIMMNVANSCAIDEIAGILIEEFATKS